MVGVPLPHLALRRLAALGRANLANHGLHPLDPQSVPDDDGRAARGPIERQRPRDVVPLDHRLDALLDGPDRPPPS